MKPIITTVLSTLIFTACGSSTPPQTISGRVSTATFPYPVDVVRAVRGGREVASAPVAADGSFTVVIPAGTRYRLELAATDGRAGLVFPRTVGAIESTFDVRGGGAPFDLGAVRYIGDPATHVYRQAPSGTQDGDVECEDGVDPSGAVCVDDDAEETGSCEADDDDVNCEDGIDPATGNECDGGPAANQDDGSEGAETETETDDGPAEGAVADHNLPSTVGCDGGSEHENEGEEEGEH